MQSVICVSWFLCCLFIVNLFEFTNGQQRQPISSQQQETGTARCPVSCFCRNTEVRCLRQHLNHVPSPLWTTTELDLRYNRIQEIPSRVLAGYRNLHTIFLNENQITTIRTRAFEDLSGLRFLFLNKNKISRIESDAFSNLQSLRNLYLQSNQISSFDVTTFSNLPRLEILNLQDNKIVSIPNGAFENLPNLRRLNLRDNDIMCDCSMMKFMKMLRRYRSPQVIEANCNAPSNMIGKHLNDVQPDEFHCTPPELTEHPVSAAITLHRSTILRCKALGDPTPHITWTKDAQSIPHNGPRRQILFDGTLLIENFTTSDAGQYRCIATNDVGQVESEYATLTFHEPIKPIGEQPPTIDQNIRIDSNAHTNQNLEGVPTIVVPPSNLEIEPHDRIVLHCVTLGSPKPDVSWYFNDVVLRETNTIKIYSNGTLVVENSEEENSGVYRCQAKNSFGVISASANVEFNAEPVIVLAPENETLKVDDEIQLQCEAEGVPTPTITWHKDGVLIETKNRIYFGEQNIELHIEHAVESDSGIYTCVAENSIGSTDAEAQIIVRGAYGPPIFEYEPYDDEVVPGTVIEIPCKAVGDGNFQVKWQKDGRTLSQLPRYRFSASGSLFISNVTIEDTGRYECHITNEYGRVSGSGLIIVRNEKDLAPGDRYIRIAFAEATREVDKSINQTIASLFDGKPQHHGDLFRLFNFPSASDRELARSAEIYERTLTNIRKHLDEGATIKVNVTQFNYTEILSEKQLDLVARLSGCTAHRIKPNCTNICYHRKYRSVDGTCNNLVNSTWGSSLTGFRRLLPPIYENGFSMPIGWTKGKLYNGFQKPSARLVSTSLISTDVITPDSKITHMMMQWGQFLDHDLDHALPSVSSESWDGIDCKKSCEYAAPCYPIEIPENDPRVTNRRCIDFVRSSAVCGSGMTSVLFKTIQPREQINQLTSYIDASQVYGYSDEFSRDLRDQVNNDGTLREGVHFPNQKSMLPFASPADGIDCRRNLDESNINCFVAGDIRVNEQVGLLAMHVIWFREHNRIAKIFHDMNPHWSSDIIYNEARKIVGAQVQMFTYEHWLPKILGKQGLELMGKYEGYNPNIDPSISNEFATAALRFGHSLINPILHRFDENFNEIPQGHLPLSKAFFAPWRIVYEGGVDPLMRGMFSVPAKLKLPQQNLNTDLTEKLFKTAHAVALDLAAINIQRSRDHGIPGYNEYRKICNLTYAETFEDLRTEISSAEVRNKLKELYGHPSNIDIWVGGILEDQVDGGKVGPLFRCLLIEQFQRLRDGDRFWYENPELFKPEQLAEIRKTSLARVLCDNGDNITQISDDVFVLPKVQGGYKQCSKLPEMDLRVWVDCSACSNTCNRNSNLDRPRRSLRSKRDTASIAAKYVSNSSIVNENDPLLDNRIEEDMNEERIGGLEALVERFEKSLKQIRRKLKKLEQTCSNGKPQKHGHCVDDTGIRRLNNEIWSKDFCTKCECVHHQVNCTREICPKLDCPKVNQIVTTGVCCPTCSVNMKNSEKSKKDTNVKPTSSS